MVHGRNHRDTNDFRDTLCVKNERCPEQRENIATGTSRTRQILGQARPGRPRTIVGGRLFPVPPYIRERERNGRSANTTDLPTDGTERRGHRYFRPAEQTDDIDFLDRRYVKYLDRSQADRRSRRTNR